MGLKRLTERIYFLPHIPALDRPMLAYLKGDRFSLAVDAGYSANHVRDFYEALDRAELKRPDFTVITHWHYDHTFGMSQVHGVTAVHMRTNAHLRELSETPDYAAMMKAEDPCFGKEYAHQPDPNIVLGDIAFHKELVFNLGA